MQKTTGKEPDNSPMVAVSITVMALTAMAVLAFNFFITPDRATVLNPPVKRGAHTAAPQNAPSGASATTPAQTAP